MADMLAWIKDSVIETMTEHAILFQPYETGGCLLGYWVKPLEEVVVCDIIGAGPNAIHSEVRFEPDSEWQTSKIAEIYTNSGCMYYYLGDWHSHPNIPNANLSWRDRKTLRIIATHLQARAPHPIMGIISKNETWFCKFWCYNLKDYKLFSVGTKQEFKNIRVYK